MAQLIEAPGWIDGTAFAAGHAGMTETRAGVPEFRLAWERLGVTSPRDVRVPTWVGESFFSEGYAVRGYYLSDLSRRKWVPGSSR